MSTNTTLAAPLGHINLHVRDGAAILLHQQPAYTIAETRAGPYALLVHQAEDGYAFGTAYIDDGETVPPTPNTTLTITARRGALTLRSSGDYQIAEQLGEVTVLGVEPTDPQQVMINGALAVNWTFDSALDTLVIHGLNVNLNQDIDVMWH